MKVKLFKHMTSLEHKEKLEKSYALKKRKA